MSKSVKIGKVRIGGKQSLALIAGPCVIEGRKKCIDLAERLVKIARSNRIPLVFKASYDKANRTSHKSYRGPGLKRGLDILKEIKETFDIPVLTDVHDVAEVPVAAEVVDVLQIPAFLCRQTDLVMAAAETGKVVNVKKGQFLSPEDVEHVIAKIEKAGNHKLMITERGVSFGYQNLVVDMRSLLKLREFGYPVVFDATHSVQKPGAASGRSGGDARMVPGLARAAVATGCDAVFAEIHQNPARALSDKDNALALAKLLPLWRVLTKIDRIIKKS